MKRNIFKKIMGSPELTILLLLSFFCLIFFMTYEVNRVYKHRLDVEKFDQIKQHLMNKYPSETKKL